jgi:hypothetical protein
MRQVVERAQQASVTLSAQEDVSRPFAGDTSRAVIARSTHVDAVEKVLSGTE